VKKECFNYVPVTMDELMGRFVLNLHRNVHIENFNGSKKVLEVNDLRNEAEYEI
jgi:hypothetical protein